MKNKAFSQKKIEKAINAINDYYDNHDPRAFYIAESYLVENGICKHSESRLLVSKLVNLGLIDYSRNNTHDILAINRLPSCVTYFERKNDAAKQAAFAKTISIISLVLSLLSVATVILDFIWQNFVGK